MPLRPPADLTPDIREALDHPTRREILRSLARSADGLSVRELAPSIPGAGISAVSYHLAFLARSGTVSLTPGPWRDGSPTWRYGRDFARP